MNKTKILNVILIITLILGTLMTTVQAVDSNLNLERTTGTLTITKMEVNNNVQSPLKGVTFDIYKIADDEESTEIPTNADILATKQSLTTGDDGVVKFEDLALGRYLVVESDAPSNVVSKIANFIVDIPMTENDGTTLNYDVEVTPKNNTVYGGFVLHLEDEDGNVIKEAGFELQKLNGTDWEKYNSEDLATGDDGTITLTGLPSGSYRFVQLSTADGYILDNKTTYGFEVELAKDGTTSVTPETVTVINEKPEITREITTTLTDGSLNIGDTVSYKVTSEVPSTIDRIDTYQIQDVLEEGLTYDESTIEIKGIASDSSETTLSASDYTATYDAGTGTITITFTNANLTSYEKIQITYSATVNEDADATSTGNASTSTLTYSTIVNTNYNDEGNTETKTTTAANAVVYTGGFWIEKRATNTSGELLQGAVFKIATSEANAKAGIYLTDESGADITLTTTSTGTVSYKGLTYGTYYLVEVTSPSYMDGDETKYYNLLKSPVEIEITADTYSSTTPTTVVVNKKGFELPATGGMGTIIVTFVGIVVIVAGIIVYRRGKKEENK